MGWLIATDVVLWIAAAISFFVYGQWIIALILAIVALVLLFILTSGASGDGVDIFDDISNLLD
jgi:hypothetical protein